MELTHASFFSGVGGLDLGLERAGWRTVSFSEIDPYASAVLAQRWPGVPNLGDITAVAQRDGRTAPRLPDLGHRADAERRTGGRSTYGTATLWTGGFPCQDLSVAGKRRGLAGSRSGLAFAFLELVGRYRPRFVLLENVPGLLSSHAGRDFGTLLATLVELGYGVGYRVLDARYFGVPQRRRRVFILGDSLGGRAGAERAAEVLSVGSRCHRHPPAGIEAGPGAAGGAPSGADIVGTIAAGLGHHGNGGHSRQAVNSGHVVADEFVRQALTTRQERNNIPGDQQYVISPSPDARGVRAPDGLARGLDDRGGVVQSLDTKRGGPDDNEAQAGHLIAGTIREHVRPGSNTDLSVISGASGMTDDPLLPLGLDSHRYRCCGNGVVADVAEWIGRRLAEVA